MNQSRQITEAAILMAIYFVLLITGLFIPFAMMVVVFLLPIPFVLYTANHGLKPALLMLTATLIFSVIIIVALPFTIIASITGILIGLGIKQNQSVYETLIKASGGVIIGFMVLLIFMQVGFGINLSDTIDTSIEESMVMTEALLTQFGLDDMQIDVAAQLELAKEQMMAIKIFIPTLIAITSIIVAFVVQLLSFKIYNRLNQTKHRFPVFRELNFPKVLLWLYLITMIFTIIEINPESSLFLAVANVYALLSFLLIIQGFSFVFKFAYEKKLHLAIPIIFVVISFFIPQIFMVFVRIIGIIDIGFSLKKRITKKHK